MNWVIKKLGDIWCLITHDFVLDKHKMHKAYGPQECQICGRWWKLQSGGGMVDATQITAERWGLIRIVILQSTNETD